MNIKLPFLTINVSQNLKEILQLALTAIIAFGYVFLVYKGKANVEGFIVLAVYVIKKFLDIVEKENGGGAK